MPNVEEMLDMLFGSMFFSSVDLGNAYYQVELEEESQIKTAFSTRTGQFCFTRMPFGIAAAPATFQNLMNNILEDMNGKEAIIYLDDILIFSKYLKDHITSLNRLFSRIKNAGLRINAKNAIF